MLRHASSQSVLNLVLFLFWVTPTYIDSFHIHLVLLGVGISRHRSVL